MPIVGPIMIGVALWRHGKLGDSLKELNDRYLLAKQKSENEIDQIVAADREFAPSHLRGHVKYAVLSSRVIIETDTDVEK